MRDNQLIMHLFQRFCWLDDGLQARLHDRGWPDVSRAQSMVMVNVLSGFVRPAEIARRMGVSRQAIHTTIAQLVEIGILTLEPDPHDKRQRRVAVTAYGARMRSDAQQAMDAVSAAVKNAIGAASYDALLSALEADWGPVPTGRPPG
ncbi:MarR family winged helix-turn-helix transcriptional regulator [Sphingosinicella soli]|uniref:DNA-binding MarR family transcriptional regulator n=1 Tax=Sphingosinicella soli TaxID=333708 RepID=A0A7W7B2E4_9SPHN|nr:MarR family winged helix-turn-helix transcriptional regulator [Sphingosinicella soli]MBB4632741.1 DNA-binding MarR family transcriptional regulator [Sphingosinicella soli]